MRKAKFRVGDKVYTYQSKTKKALVIRCDDRGIENGTDWGFHYLLTLPDGTQSKWTGESPESISKKPLE